jgi:hypothetical protein
MTWRNWVPAAGSGAVTLYAGMGWLESPELVAWFAATLATGLGTVAWVDRARGANAWGEWPTWRLVVAAACGVSVLIALGQWRVVGASGPTACLPGAIQLFLLAVADRFFPVQFRG